MICLGLRGHAQDSTGIQISLLDRYERLKPAGLLWCDTGAPAADLRATLRSAYLSMDCEGIYGRVDVRALLATGEDDILNRIGLDRWEQRYDRAALALGWNFFRGTGTEQTLSYDGISARYITRDEQWIAHGLAAVRTAGDLQDWLSGLLPVAAEYAAMRDSLSACQDDRRTAHAARLARAMNDYRWVHHFPFKQAIVVNIPSAGLRYYAADTLRLSMRVVAGQPSKRTPRFAGWCDGLVLYPYWNVPRKIAVHELLPLFKWQPEIARDMQLQVVDAQGRVVDVRGIRWSDYTEASFPYSIRQAPGCLNALGVLRFNVSDPFDVYMHDTNLKQVFGKDYRYYSHGCIRLEKPFELGLALTQGRLDTTILVACFKDQQPIELPLPAPVPVFVLYNTVGVGPDGKLSWYPDVYGLKL